MIIKLILAVDENGCIGKLNTIPWKLSDDFKHFKNITSNDPIIMGSKTFESLPSILPDREHLVLSGSNRIKEQKNVRVFEYLQDIYDYLLESDYEESSVIGGSQIAKLFSEMGLIDEYVLTHVHTVIEDGDTFIDLDLELDLSNWSVINEKKYYADDKNEYDFTVRFYKRNIKRFYQ